MTDLGVFAAILDNSERLLLCRRRDVDLWEMPGGRVEAGESPWDALGREVSEETGLTVELFRLVGLYWRPRRELLVLQFEVACRGRPVTSPEVREVGFFSMDPLPEPINPAVIERIEDLRGGSRAVQLRTQLGPSGQEWLAARQQLQGT